MLQFLFPKMHTQLGRWCHVTAPMYEKTCNWESKVDMANHDNSICVNRPSPIDTIVDKKKLDESANK